MALQLDRTIAERTLVLGNGRRQLRVRLGMPRRVKNDWVCPYQLHGLGRKAVRGAFGVDAFQALMMALESIREDLAAINEPLTWVGGQAGDSGFGLIVHSFIGPAANARVEEMVEREANGYFSREVAARKKSRDCSAPAGHARGPRQPTLATETLAESLDRWWRTQR